MPDNQSKHERNIVAEVRETWGNMKGMRGTWENHWQQIADRVIPSISDRFQRNYITKGNKRNEFIFDSTPVVALQRFASILDSLLTPRNQVWQRLKADEPELNNDRQVRLWFEEVNRILFKERYATTANFAAQNISDYLSLGAFGTSALFIDPLANSLNGGLRYKNCHLGGIYIKENHQGIIDTVIRNYSVTARQMKLQWGDKIPDGVETAIKRNDSTEFEVLHCVKPRNEFDPNRLDGANMPWASYYISLTGDALLEESGYTTFPYIVSRYQQSPGEVYGRSPAMDVLPAIKTLNEEKKTLLKQGHRTVDPILLAHDDGVLDNFSLKPGSLNAGGVSKDGRALVHTLPTGRIDIGKDLMDDERKVINDAFLVSLFEILLETPQMTATEVMERAREKGILLAPTVGRQEAEKLGPMVERELDILSKQGLLPEMPPILEEAGAKFDIEYDSPLSRVQRAEEASGLMRSVEMTLGIVNVTQDPTPLDHYNWDVIVPEVSDINAVPTKWRRSMEEVESIRADRAAAKQREEAVAAAPGAAALMNAGTKARQG